MRRCLLLVTMPLILVLFLLSLGIGYSQVISAPRSVTLRWLRLGDLIALSLLTGAAVLILAQSSEEVNRFALVPVVVLLVGFVGHLALVQLGRRTAQRILIGATVAVVSTGALLAALPFLSLGTPSVQEVMSAPELESKLAAVGFACGLLLSAWMLGGYLMTMMLGHAYLTAGSEMTQRPFLRLCRGLLAGLGARAAVSLATGLLPWWRAFGAGALEGSQTWSGMLIVVRYLVGLLVPVGLTCMVYHCVRIRSNQSATGILYVASILILIGELSALSLMIATGFGF